MYSTSQKKVDVAEKLVLYMYIVSHYLTYLFSAIT